MRFVPVVLSFIAMLALLMLAIVLWLQVDSRLRPAEVSTLFPPIAAVPVAEATGATPAVELAGEPAVAPPALPLATELLPEAPIVAAVPTVAPPATATPASILLLLPTVTPAPSAGFQPAPAAALVTGLRHEWQSWNNCGPTTVTMYMSAYGSTLDQAAARTVLRPDADDKNVSPDELVDYARSQGYLSLRLVNGSADLMRTFLANGMPVLVETWHGEEMGEGIGHYRLLTGYDDAQQQWTLYDSLDSSGLMSLEPYSGIVMDYGRFDQLWQVFNRSYVLVYPAERGAQVDAILATFGVDPATMWAAAQAQAIAEIGADEGNGFAWFNLGGALAAQGNFADAAAAFDQAFALNMPWRMLWYQFSALETYIAVGRTGDVLALTATVLEKTESIEEIHYWRGRALAAQGDVAGAQQAWQQALALNPNFAPAQRALAPP